MTGASADVTELPASPGARLRHARELHGLTQQQAAEQLNLDISVVTALEADDFAALGAPVFAKGHLRRYAAMLGLPEDEVLSGYERSKAQPEQPTLIPRARVEMLPERSRPNWTWIIGGATAFLLAGALAAYLSTYGLSLPSISDLTRRGVEQSGPGLGSQTEPAGQGSGADSSAASEPGPAGGPAALATDAAAGRAAIGQAGASAGALARGQVALELRFTADSWVEIYDGTGRAVFYDLGKGGTVRTVTAMAPVSVTLGNAAAVRVAVNGRLIAPVAVAAGQTVARFSVDADGAVR